jgi:hypothetical protein
METREPLNIRVEASAEKVAEATLTALRMSVYATYTAQLIGWSAAQMSKLGDAVKDAPGQVRRGFLTDAFAQAIKALPESNPFRDALRQMAEYDVARVKD